MSRLAEAITELRTNPEQWVAFTAVGNIVVLAPPGSGKTQLLTARAASDLREQLVGPRGAACITMTNEAAWEMRRRLDTFGVQRRPNLFVGTVHSFALGRIVLPFAKAAGEELLAESSLVSDAEAEELLRDIYLGRSFRNEDFANIRTNVMRVRQRMDFSGDLQFGGSRIADLAQEFSAELRTRRQYDFVELISWAVYLVEEHPWIRQTLSACFPRIYVDEYQDLAPGLDRIVRALTVGSTGSGSDLFAVGDPDQSIYAFSGAHPELLRSLSGDPRTVSVRLRRNYRSGQNVIDSGIRVLGEHRDVTGQSAGGSLKIHGATGGVPGQSELCVKLVQTALGRGVAPEEIAVLTSWKSDREEITGALRSAGVLCFSRAQLDWHSTPGTVLVERLAAWALRGESMTLSLSVLLDRLPAITGGPVSHKAKVEVVRLLFDSDETTRITDFLERLSVALAEDRGVRATRDDGFASMRSAYSETGPLSNHMLSNLALLAHAPDHVMVATIHASKGLEFDYVIVAGVDEQVMPGWNADESEWEEARRLLYVAITRARRGVDIVYTDTRWSKRKQKSYNVKRSPLLEYL